MSDQRQDMARREPFPLLQLPPGVLATHLLPALSHRSLAALALTCQPLRALVQANVTDVKLVGGECCQVVAHPELARRMPNATSLQLLPRNLHEAMYVLPQFLMQVGFDWASSPIT